MNIIENMDKYDASHLYFCESIKNNVMNEGKFIRILYSNELFTMNGISILLNNIQNADSYKNKYNFNIELINNIKFIEENILHTINIKNKTPQYKIYQQIKNGNIKVFENNEICNNLVLKISGIWETDLFYGITYKFLKINHL